MLGQSVHACWLAWMWNVPHRLMFQYHIYRRWHCLGRLWTLPDHTHPSRISHTGLALQAAAASGSSLSCLLPCPFVQMWTSPARGSLSEWSWPLHHAFLITMDPNQRIYLPSSCFCLVLCHNGEKIYLTQSPRDIMMSVATSDFAQRGSNTGVIQCMNYMVICLQAEQETHSSWCPGYMCTGAAS